MIRSLLVATALLAAAPAQQIPGYGISFSLGQYGQQNMPEAIMWNGEPALVISSRPGRNGGHLIAGLAGPGIPVKLDVVAFAFYEPRAAHWGANVDVAYGLTTHAINYIAPRAPWVMPSNPLLYELFPAVIRTLEFRRWDGWASWMGCWWFWTLCKPSTCTGLYDWGAPMESVTICRVRLG